jgi:hypothetical protein
LCSLRGDGYVDSTCSSIQRIADQVVQYQSRKITIGGGQRIDTDGDLSLGPYGPRQCEYGRLKILYASVSRSRLLAETASS